MNQLDLRDRIAIITGGARGIGYAAAERALRSGASVVLWDIDSARVERAVAELTPLGIVSAEIVELSDAAAVASATDAILARHGRIDILVNNAGIGEGLMPAWEMPLETWQKTIDVDLTGVFHGCRAVLPTMLEQGWGRIVNISSIAGKEGKHNPVAYAAAKAGVIGLTKALAFDVAERGILVNAITPGSIMTRNWSHLAEDEIDAVRRRHPIGRLGRPEEVAAMVAWLSSDECSFSSGAVFDISGGRAGH